MSNTYNIIIRCLKEKNNRNMMMTSCIGIFISMLIYLSIGSILNILYEGEFYELFKKYNEKFNTIIIIGEKLLYITNILATFPITFSALKNYAFFSVSALLTKIRDSQANVKNT